MRKLSRLVKQRLINGDLKVLLDEIKSDKELRLEIRREGDAYVYYKKGKILKLKNLEVGKNYGDVPDVQLVLTDSKKFFSWMKGCVEEWLKKNSKRAEFYVQQNVAQSNQDETDRYVILDMEYAFERKQIVNKETRPTRATFDLLGIERETNKIVFFELKNGKKAINGKSGIESHIVDFKNYIHCTDQDLKVKFRANLIDDIKNIIQDKKDLGLLDSFDYSSDSEIIDPELVFIFHPDSNEEIKMFNQKLNGEYKLIVVSDQNFKLNEYYNSSGD